MIKPKEFRVIMCNYDDDDASNTFSVTASFDDNTSNKNSNDTDDDFETEEERDIAERMIRELWQHQQEGHGGWYYKDFLIDNIYNSLNSENYEQLQEKVYQRLVKNGSIDVLETDPNRCAIGKHASVSIFISY